MSSDKTAESYEVIVVGANSQTQADKRCTIMNKNKRAAFCMATLLTSLGAVAFSADPGSEPSAAIAPDRMRRIGTVDERYQSYNIEMLEVTGGKFWRPYGPELDALLKQPPPSAAPSSSGDTPSEMNPALYEYRPPIDLTNGRLRKLAAALGPAYVRVSGTWANSTYFPERDEAPAKPPAGFMGVLTRQQWKGVVDFSKAADAKIVTSFATSVGTRDDAGVWTAEQAKRLVDYTKSVGGHIAAAEFMNEPTFAAMGGAPAGYDAAAYGRDFKVFRTFVKEAVPDMLILGPGSVGETTGDWGVAYGNVQMLKTRDLLAACGRGTVDGFSYHHYGASSLRCSAVGMPGTTVEDALSEQWLRRTDETLAFYRPLRDEFDPGKAFWNTETADAACGGNPWAATFIDTFRYLDQLGRLAKQDVRVVVHNTLVASDYGLLDDETLAPKPNYWGALLWRKLMGTTVLNPGPSREGLHLYAHSLRGHPGGVALLIINNGKTASQSLNLTTAAERYTLTAKNLTDRIVQLNGNELNLGPNDALPELKGTPTKPGQITFAPASITFLAVRDAHNNSAK
jgi:hypothetical protein